MIGYALSAFGSAAVAQVTVEPSPIGYGWQTYTWVIVLSAWGGLVAHLRQYMIGHVPNMPLIAAFVDVGSSILAGFLIFLACESVEMSQLKTGVMVGLAGHLGTRMLRLMEKKFLLPYLDKVNGSVQQNNAPSTGSGGIEG